MALRSGARDTEASRLAQIEVWGASSSRGTPEGQDEKWSDPMGRLDGTFTRTRLAGKRYSDPPRGQAPLLGRGVSSVGLGRVELPALAGRGIGRPGARSRAVGRRRGA